MKKLIVALVLLLCFVLVAVSCTPDDPYELKTDENGNVVTNEKGEPETIKKGGGLEVKDHDDEDDGRFGELIPTRTP